MVSDSSVHKHDVVVFDTNFHFTHGSIIEGGPVAWCNLLILSELLPWFCIQELTDARSSTSKCPNHVLLDPITDKAQRTVGIPLTPPPAPRLPLHVTNMHIVCLPKQARIALLSMPGKAACHSTCIGVQQQTVTDASSSMNICICIPE